MSEDSITYTQKLHNNTVLKQVKDVILNQPQYNDSIFLSIDGCKNYEEIRDFMKCHKKRNNLIVDRMPDSKSTIINYEPEMVD
jgi:5,10-methenyltetrahydromethanopterin hydrogenase